MNQTSRQSFHNKTWSYLQADRQQVATLQAELTLPEPVATILVHRGVSTSMEARDFLYPTLQNLPSPFLMKGMLSAVEIIARGIVARTPIVVYGDYDVDGVTATAVLVRFFGEAAGSPCHSCHPDRFKNGYGLKAQLVEAMGISPPGIVITVDCGISDGVEVDRLVQAGWQVIVTDHHQPPPQLPKAHAVLNPWQEDCQFPSKELAGVGVSFYLAMGVRNYLHQQGYWQGSPPPNLKKVLDLVAVGTISDMVPLRQTNRVLAKAGLDVLSSTENQGLTELLDLCRIPRGQAINHEDIAFQLGPRLNAAGRMGDAKRASTLLASQDHQLVRHLAETIEQANIERREMTSQLLDEAVAMVRQQASRHQPCIILHSRDWHLGLLGIISSKLVDLYGKPTIIFGGQGRLKGSARSIPGLNIHEVIAACAQEGKILEFGGHSSAAGLSIREEDWDNFLRVTLNKFAEKGYGAGRRPSLTIDFVITEQTAVSDLEAVNTLLAPFGQSNPEPIFTTSKPCRLRNMQLIGKEKNHLRFSAFLAGRWLDGVGFGFGNLIDRSLNGEASLTMAFSLKESRYNGQTKLKLTLHDALI